MSMSKSLWLKMAGASALASVGLWSLAGCNSAKAPVPTAQIASATPPTVLPVVVPKPAPKPDPLLEYRRSLQIPTYAQGKVFKNVPVKPGTKPFALTFDDGPWPHSTRAILKILAENDVKATFFMVGEEVSRRPEIAREVRAAGHAIGSHSWNHPSRPRDAVAQIQRTDAVLKKEVGITPTMFRPPYGLLKNGMAGQAMKEKQAILIWSADCADWKRPGSAHIARMIIGQASPGGIALMHDGGGDRSQTVAALPVIIRDLKARGYYFVTIPELLRLRHIAPPKPKAKPKATAKPKSHKS